MRVVIQKVKRASVTVDSNIVGKINRGLCVLVGITHDDTEKDIDYMVKKILNTRVFEDSEGKHWTKSVKDLDLEVLSVSQFTLYVNCQKGNKPDFHAAMKSDNSRDFYEKFLNKLKQEYKPEKIQDGQFGAMMDVEIINDGPVTFPLDSRKFVYSDSVASTKNNTRSNTPQTPL
ncbi:D-tyrosyl-tRNA deacylase-like protein [Conidiobolus coronatus NRRL 28638]|uniref:D-aminoacyl-tRNA deacylase n=1 Tax=Conidiobolus coronatus (strain ATCC 28846 / CBS 209.66 / NRRL 28638) TaxID=796925 RepID=A0A137PBK8_CONC2|nr:D-tyrosyl-tRNA deacylase-like protein [Conidiobolus coronatus NRRL 28638]|eukprot:KXN72342.1 D-tyrosyl-tRNA deacylase-like protein [Conidiobolus coronatus NRRL 28638]